MSIPPAVDKLVQRFEDRGYEYMSPEYMEARLRIDFLNPFFQALGWDIANVQGHSEHEREVITEGRMKTSAGLKFPDYIFQVNGKPVFTVEAKKPSVNLKTNPVPALQLRRYAWNAGNIGVGILTDFHEFAVYDCRVAPEANDPASKALIDYYKLEEYRSRWTELDERFSRDAVRSGSLEEYMATFKAVRGQQRVDKLFLNALDAWRKEIAWDIARRNRLSEDQINSAVQLIIDRIVFLRVAEDRGLEPYGELLDSAKSRQTYRQLQLLFAKADQKYDSGLFHLSDEDGKSEKDELTPNLVVGNDVLTPFIRSLYWPNGPYDFQVLPPDILGQVYEQFLGKVIRLVSPRNVVIEEKPEVRKAKGVFYTPTIVVADIVRATLEPVLEKASPKTFEKNGLFICDPACGSGSFLIEVYQQLLDWHLTHYMTSPEKFSKGRKARLNRNVRGEWRLTTAEKKRILLQYVLGVDIDPQAVEVTKLALLLKLLEDETEASLYEQTAILHDRVLPDLADNIKCGNSLVGNAIHFQAPSTLDAAFEKKVNAFDWDLEFPNVAAGRGFDVIVGNPPWLMAGYYVADSASYLRDNFSTATGKFDLYYLFIEQSIRLLSPGGRFGVIVPNKMFHTRAAKALRKLLAERSAILTIKDFGISKIFEGATNYSCILLGRNESPTEKLLFQRATADLHVTEQFVVDQSQLGQGLWNFQNETARALFQRLASATYRLEHLAERFGTGVQTGSDRLLTFDRPAAEALGLESEMLAPILRGRDVRAYTTNSDPRLMIFPYHHSGDSFVLMSEKELAKYPNTFSYLKLNRLALMRRVWFGKSAVELSGAWYGHMYVEQRKYVTRSHLLTPSLSPVSNFALGTGDLFATGTAGVTSVVLKDGMYDARFVLAVLNSNVVTAWVRSHSPVFQGGFRKFSAPYLKDIPIPKLDLTWRADRMRHDEIVSLVDALITSRQKLEDTDSDHKREFARRQLAAAIRMVDDEVSAMYGVTLAEKAWVRSTASL